jgi:hypothetical protein
MRIMSNHDLKSYYACGSSRKSRVPAHFRQPFRDVTELSNGMSNLLLKAQTTMQHVCHIQWGKKERGGGGAQLDPNSVCLVADAREEREGKHRVCTVTSYNAPARPP